LPPRYAPPRASAGPGPATSFFTLLARFARIDLFAALALLALAFVRVVS
jgi:hypothetical protein